MPNKKTLLTYNGLKELESELEYLKGKKRLEIAEKIKEARSFGDLSENADYHKAKEDQGFLEGKILEIKHILNFAIIAAEKSNGQDTVSVGCKVTVQEEDFPPETYYLVGSKEADPIQNKISHVSPIGNALLKKQVGDTVNIKTPSGVFELKIISID